MHKHLKNIYVINMFCICCLLTLCLTNGIWSILCHKSFTDNEEGILERATVKINDYIASKYVEYRRILDQIHTYYGCCGWNGTYDWRMSNYFKTRKQFPMSCCIEELREVDCGRDERNINTEGCFIFYKRKIQETYVMFGAVQIMWAAIQFFIISLLAVYTLRMGSWHYNDVRV
ncbi:Tetraspanin-6 [Thelohanellus kitauei]|uniref:Tetraspanin-6 n=1 Tax=Thelohanellus kitauei TaxID=669202 RepID=A0A0C2MQL7_THEKT|nr:Tetraspanin-6 [Thelohanellus kitauei]